MREDAGSPAGGDDRDERIEELKDQVRYLREVVASRDEEIRRRDYLLAAALKRIPELEAAQRGRTSTEGAQRGSGRSWRQSLWGLWVPIQRRLWVPIKRRLWVPIVLGVIGVGMWAIPPTWPTSWPEYIATPNRLSELGAAIAAGAIISFAVLYIERLYESEAEKMTVQLEFGSKREIDIDLRDLNLTGIRWYKKTIKAKDCANTKFDEAYLRDCTFDDTDLRGASFKGANLRGTKFIGAKLAAASFKNARLPRTEFRNPDFNTDERDPVTKEKYGKANFKKASLYKTDLTGADLSNVKGLGKARRKDEAVIDDNTTWPDKKAPEDFGFNRPTSDTQRPGGKV